MTVPTFPVTIQHLEVGVKATIDSVDQLVAFLLTQNPLLWSDWYTWKDLPEFSGPLQAAGLVPQP